MVSLAFPLPYLDLNQKITTFKASFHNNANPSTPLAQKTHKQATWIFARAQLWSIIIKCLLVGGRGASSHSHSSALAEPLTSDLSSNNATSSRPTTQFSSRAESTRWLQD